MNVYTLYSAIQKFGISKIFNTIQISLMLIKATFIWSKMQKKTVILWNIITI